MNLLKTKIVIISLLLALLFACHNKKSEIRLQNSDLSPQTISLAKLSDQIKANPKNADLYNERAKYYLSQKQTNNALDDINKAIQIKPDKSSFYCTLSDCYFEMGSVTKCSDALDKALSLDSKNTEALLRIAELNFFFKKYDKTYEYIKELLILINLTPGLTS